MLFHKSIALIIVTCTGMASAIAAPSLGEAYCEQVNGQISVLRDSTGNTAFCEFDRAMIDNATLYQASVLHQGTQATASFLTHADPSTEPTHGMSPAYLYCKQVGGSIKIYLDVDSNELGICHFADGSQIEEWTLFRGPNDPQNQALTALLSGIQ